jgi:RecA-family ATPase
MAFVPDPTWPSIVALGIEIWGPVNKAQSKRDEVRFGTNGSKKVIPSKHLWHDHESGERGGYIKLWDKARRGAPLPPRTDGLGKNGNGGRHTGVPPWEDIKETYPYPGTDVDPRLIEVVRTRSGKPRFRQRQQTGSGKWLWSVADIADHDRRIYRLAELRAAPKAERIWICAGEKDSDRLFNAGLTAVTNIGGEGKWRSDYAAEFRGRHCIALQDNDETGRKHCAELARSLHGVAASIKVLLLPGLRPKADVSDFLDAGHTLNELEKHADAAPEYVPTPGKPELPAIEWRDVRLADWKDRDPPDRLWVVPDWIPLLQVTGFYGVGGIGKTALLIQLLMASSKGLPFLGYQLTATGPVYGLFCEDTEAEIVRRAERIAAHYGMRLADFPDVHFASLVGVAETEFVTFDGAAMAPTDALRRFNKKIAELGAKLAVLDTIPDFFGGNEIVRREVSRFVRALDAISITHHCAVVFTAHPSVRGRKEGTLDSGSTGWEGKVRSRLSLHDPGEEGEEEDLRKTPAMPTDRRILTRQKANYARQGETIELVWREGVFTPGAVDPAQAAKRARGPGRNDACDAKFLELLAKVRKQGGHVHDASNVPSRYAPKVFAQMPSGVGFSVPEYTRAMRRLFDAGRLRLEPFGKPSDDKRRLAEVAL